MITWQNATEGSTEIETGDYVTINGTNYPVKTKKTSSTPLSAENLNTNQANLIDFTQLSNGNIIPSNSQIIDASCISDIALRGEFAVLSLTNATQRTNGIIPLTNFSTTTDKLSYSNNGIMIGEGVTKVLVMAQCFGEMAVTNKYLWTEIQQNSTSISIVITPSANGYASTTHIKPVLVNSGDVFKLNKLDTENDNLRSGANTYIAVIILK
jgi:hypothetical protein